MFGDGVKHSSLLSLTAVMKRKKRFDNLASRPLQIQEGGLPDISMTIGKISARAQYESLTPDHLAKALVPIV
jgi:hypothetical protein